MRGPNDRAVTIPVVRGRALLDYTNDTCEVTYAVAIDERFSFKIDYWNRSGYSIKYSKISYPSAGGMEKQLAEEKHMDVYGIYFNLGSDSLRSESEPVLREISEGLAKNPDWKLSIEGHMDNVCGDTANLDLFNRRSEAVRKELVAKYTLGAARLTGNGHGASRPKDSNETPEGHARNRRVELVRRSRVEMKKTLGFSRGSLFLLPLPFGCGRKSSDQPTPAAQATAGAKGSATVGRIGRLYVELMETGQRKRRRP